MVRASEIVRNAARRTRAGTTLGLTNQLSHLVRLYGGTDKGVHGHGYTPYYEVHLGPRRLKRHLVFEIGVGGYAEPAPGGSLSVWRDYLVRSKIVGLDIEPKIVELGSRVAFEQADQSSAADLQRVVDAHGRPHIVIDDGSHVGTHIQAAFEFLWPVLLPGGVYVIEDLSCSYYPSFDGGDPPPPSSGVGLVEQLVDCVQAQDSTFRRKQRFGSRSAPRFDAVASLHVYPGVAFVEKVA
jgi:hypothetical protein